jgi:acyl-CoA synthetase (AMP-forming)/AMP-acid ligase II
MLVDTLITQACVDVGASIADGSEPVTQIGSDWAGQAIGSAWTTRAQLTPAAVALIFDERHWSYQELFIASVRLATTLRERAIGAGERVVLMMDNGPGFVVAFFGCQLAGVLPVPASPKSSTERVQYLLSDSAARCILVEPALSGRTRALHETQSYREQIVELILNTTPGPLALEQDEPGPEACAFIQYTSGSTGHAKGVMISHRAALENIRAFSADMALTPRDVFSSLLPLFHDMGLMCFGLAPLLLGHKLVLYPQESLSIYRWLAGIADHKVTLTGAPDSLLQIANRVVEDPALYALQSLRMLICGSEPVRRDSVETFGKRFGVMHALKPAYGMAELTLCATLTASHVPFRVDANGKVASGKPINGVKVAIRTETGKRVTDADVHGEIVVHSPSAMSGYWQRPDASDQAFDSDGFLSTGDVGYLDPDGFLFVIGRQKNMLVRAGQKYSPHDLEMAAHAFPELRRAAVVQLQNAGAAIVSVLEIDRRMLVKPAVLSDLARRYRQSAFAVSGLSPDACWFVGGGTIPTTENGKFRHAALGEMIETGALQAGWADVDLELEYA